MWKEIGLVIVTQVEFSLFFFFLSFFSSLFLHVFFPSQVYRSRQYLPTIDFLPCVLSLFLSLFSSSIFSLSLPFLLLFLYSLILSLSFSFSYSYFYFISIFSNISLSYFPLFFLLSIKFSLVLQRLKVSSISSSLFPLSFPPFFLSFPPSLLGRPPGEGRKNGHQAKPIDKDVRMKRYIDKQRQRLGKRKRERERGKEGEREKREKYKGIDR